MWCTRWYLPLVLLPIPVAPPYFLLLFLFSTTMHSRPCFYCMVMLTAMFMSTCYWPPVPIDTPLVRPWSENTTTFADALHLMMPHLPDEKMPSTIPVAERCWCDLSNGFFAPFNSTKWEELSVSRLKETLQKDLDEERKAREREECEVTAGEELAEPTSCVSSEEAPAAPELPTPSMRLSFAERMIWKAFQALHSRHTSAQASPPSPSPAQEAMLPEATAEGKARATADVPQSSPKSEPMTSLPWLRREYDLRKFGFAMVLDFGWPAPSYS